jgi:hypothetical protein
MAEIGLPMPAGSDAKVAAEQEEEYVVGRQIIAFLSCYDRQFQNLLALPCVLVLDN